MAGLDAKTASLPAGGGPFSLETLTLGVFLTDQPGHRLAVGSSKATLQPLVRNEGWILPAGAEGICEFDAPLEFLTVSVEHRIIAEAGRDPRAAFAPIVGALDPMLVQMALGADAFAAGGTLYRETMDRALAAHLLSVAAPVKTPDIADGRLRRVLDYIHDNLAEDLTLAAMADLAAMSGTQFSRAFKVATGSAPLQYVIGARLDLASVLLDTTELTVAAIAYRVGYNDLSRFGQHFKRRFGSTPAAWRGRL